MFEYLDDGAGQHPHRPFFAEGTICTLNVIIMSLNAGVAAMTEFINLLEGL